jgi:NAD(P)-dependent dehydrogenase (short-subunit alcohol dehydrogenase family)
MRVVVIGAAGTIGGPVSALLAARHDVVRVGHASGEYRVDIASTESIRHLYARVGAFDALVCAAGQARFSPFEALSDDDFQFSMSNKLMGQVNLVRLGVEAVRRGGSFTLTSGVLATEPMPGGAAISLVNAALDGFVRAAALELPRNIRINVVSPPWVSETLAAMGQDPSRGMPAARVAAAYVDSVEGTATGKVIDARTFAA